MNFYQANIQDVRINISDTIAAKYINERFNNDETNEYHISFIKEVFRYLLITKGNIHKRRREEYLEKGVRPEDRFIEYGGFQGDFEGCLTHMKNVFGIKSMKTELYAGVSMAKVVYHIMRLVYLNPAFANIVEKEMKITQK
jgi:hypothetical protein